MGFRGGLGAETGLIDGSAWDSWSFWHRVLAFASEDVRGIERMIRGKRLRRTGRLTRGRRAGWVRASQFGLRGAPGRGSFGSISKTALE